MIFSQETTLKRQMKVQVENLEGHKKKVTIEIPADHVTQHVNGYFENLRSEVELKGFRKGKAPMALVKKMYADSANPRIMREIVEGHLRSALEEHSLSPITMPQVDAEMFREGSEFKFSATFEASPPVELKDYTSFKIAKKPVEIDDSQVEKTLENIRNQFATLEPLPEDAPLESGLVANLDYEASEAGVPFSPATEKDANLEIGNQTLTPDFEAAIIGMKTGETRNFTIKFPQPAEGQDSTPVSGKTLDFTVSCKAIKRKVLPNLDDELAKRLGPFTGIEDVRNRIRQDLKNEAEKRNRDTYVNDFVEWLIKTNPLEAPETLVTQQVQQLVVDTSMQLSQMGLDEKAIEERLKQWTDQIAEKATRQVKLSLLLGAILKADNIKATDEEVRTEIARIAVQSRKDPKTVLRDLQESGNIGGFVRQVAELKALNGLVDKALQS